MAESIDSDINNFLRIMNIFGIKPKGLYLDRVFDNLREELKWETDYLREADMAQKARDRVLADPIMN